MHSSLESVSSVDRNWRLLAGLLQEMPTVESTGTVSAPGILDNLEAWLGREVGVPTIGNLPALAYLAAGGDGRGVTPVLAAWQAVHLALKLFDDVEDGDAGDHASEAINTGTGLLMAAQVALEQLVAYGISLEAARSVRLAFGRAVLRACVGQQSDLVAGRDPGASTDPDGWLEIAASKSGELLGWAAWAGALAAGAGERSASHYHEYGYHLGVLLQAADDFNDVWRAGGSSDLARGRLTLPVCYALHVTTDDGRALLTDLLQRAASGGGAADAEARQILIDLGAQAYLLAVAQVQYQQAAAALQNASGIGASVHQLSTLLDQVLPVLRAVDPSK